MITTGRNVAELDESVKPMCAFLLSSQQPNLIRNVYRSFNAQICVGGRYLLSSGGYDATEIGKPLLSARESWFAYQVSIDAASLQTPRQT